MSGRCFAIFGVRYPEDALEALHSAGVRYGGYLPNLQAPCLYAASRIAVHVPRQQYVQSMTGIPTIRVFEALACGIPLISAPWNDTECLFREGDFTFVSNGEEMQRAIEHMLEEPTEAHAQAVRGRETVLARHTCAHRAVELEEICKEVLA
jgi:spore maturation protein CgeB